MEKKMRKIVLMLAAMCALVNPIPALAVETSQAVNVPCTEVAVDQESGEFQFEIKVDAGEAFAGLEFGVICAQGCEITEVTYDVDGSSTGPANSNGLTWFGFFDGADSFSGEITAIVKGKCGTGMDSAISIQDIKRYVVGNEEYKEEHIWVDEIVNLRQDVEIVEENEIAQESEIVAESNIGVQWQKIVAVIIAAVLVITFIYILIKSKGKNREEKSE